MLRAGDVVVAEVPGSFHFIIHYQLSRARVVLTVRSNPNPRSRVTLKLRQRPMVKADANAVQVGTAA